MAKSNQSLCAYCAYQDFCPHYDDSENRFTCEILHEFEDEGF